MQRWRAQVVAAALAVGGCDSVPAAFRGTTALSARPAEDAAGEAAGMEAAAIGEPNQAAGGSADGGAAAGDGGAAAADALPPTRGFADLEAWLATGAYRAWACEERVHTARPNSAHTANRICSSPALSAAGDGPYPAGAAAVKELWSGDGGRLLGYAVSVHVEAGDGGDTWYWYERTSAGGAAPEASDVVFSGRGASICQSCHAQAGVGGRTGHDFVYTQVLRQESP